MWVPQQQQHQHFRQPRLLAMHAANPQDEQMAWAAAYKTRPPSEAIVFVVGGSTYEEAKVVAEWNAKQSGSGISGAQGPAGLGGTPPAPMRALLGGSSVLNSDTFLAALGAGGGSSTDLR
jgi:vacuolar protein sorting-associated protein 45